MSGLVSRASGVLSVAFLSFSSSLYFLIAFLAQIEKMIVSIAVIPRVT